MGEMVKLAGVALLLICLANGFAFEKLGWNRNLAKTERFFTQIFKVHTVYLVLTMTAMGLACLFATDELLAAETLMVRGFLWFAFVFWGGRVILHVLYYDQAVKRANPWWNALFLSTFTFLAITFLITAVN